MAVKIRLRRMGAKKAPSYRIVVAADLSKKSASTTPWPTPQKSRSMRKRQRNGSSTAHSLPKPSEIFLKRAE